MLEIDKYGTVILEGDTLLLKGVAIPCGVNNDGNKNTDELVKCWNAYDENQELIAQQAEKITLLQEAIESALRISDLWVPYHVDIEHEGEAEALHTMRSKFIDALSVTGGVGE